MRCPHCEAENPDYVFYCGKCAKQMKDVLASEAKDVTSHNKRPAEKIENILNRNLLRIEQNVVKKRKGLSGIFGGAFLRSSTLVFMSELEEVTLGVDRDGHVTVTRGIPTTPSISLVGPHDSFLKLFQDERNIPMIPGSINIHLGNQELPRNLSQRVIREGIERFLHKLFE